MSDMVRGYLRARGKHRLIVPVRLPGRAARAFRDGANLAAEGTVGRRTWEEFLAQRVGSQEGGSPARLTETGSAL
jgi:hypothetical protein